MCQNWYVSKDRVCASRGCVKRPYAKGLCSWHYDRYRISRTPICTVEDCNIGSISRGWCQTHYRTWLRTGSPTTPPARLRGDAHPGWTGDDASYRAIHYRVKAKWGPASGYLCDHCTKVAYQWAYDQTDLDERVGPDEHGRGQLRYSLDLDRYIPLCTACHHAFDAVTHCKWGHEYTPENTYIQPSNGSRYCRECARQKQRRMRAERKAKNL